MKKVLTSKTIIMTLLIAFLILGLLLGINKYLKESKNNVSNDVKEVVNKYNFDDVSKTKEIGKLEVKSATEKNLYYKVEYPAIGNEKIDSDIESKVGDLIKNKVAKYDSSSNEVDNYYLMEYETYIGTSCTLNVVLKNVVESKDLKVLEQEQLVYNYDLATGKLLTKSDVFKGDYLNKLKEYDENVTEDFFYILKNDVLLIVGSNKEVPLNEIKDYLKIKIDNVCQYTNGNEDVKYDVVNSQYKLLKDSVLYRK